MCPVVQIIAAGFRISGVDAVIAGGRLGHVLFHLFNGLGDAIQLAAVDGVRGRSADPAGCHVGEGPGLFRGTAAGTYADGPSRICTSKLVGSGIGSFPIGVLNSHRGRACRIPIVHLRTGAQGHTGLTSVFRVHKSVAAQGHPFVPIDFCVVPQNSPFSGIGFCRCPYSRSVFFVVRNLSLVADGHAAIARTAAVLAQSQSICAAGHGTGAQGSSPAGRGFGVGPDAHRSTAGGGIGIGHGPDMDGPFRRRSGIAADGYGIVIGPGTMADGYGVIILGAGVLAQSHTAGAIGYSSGTDGRRPCIGGIGPITQGGTLGLGLGIDAHGGGLGPCGPIVVIVAGSFQTVIIVPVIVLRNADKMTAAARTRTAAGAQVKSPGSVIVIFGGNLHGTIRRRKGGHGSLQLGHVDGIIIAGTGSQSSQLTSNPFRFIPIGGIADGDTCRSGFPDRGSNGTLEGTVLDISSIGPFPWQISLDPSLGCPIGHRISPQGYSVFGIGSVHFRSIPYSDSAFGSIDNRICPQSDGIGSIGIGALFSHVIAPNGNPVGMVRRAVLPNSNRTLIIHDGIFPDSNPIGIIVRLGPGTDGHGISPMSFGLFPQSESSCHGRFRGMAD